MPGKKHNSKGGLVRAPAANLFARPQWGKLTSQGSREIRRLTYSGQLTANGAGFVGANFNAAYVRANAVEWANYAARFTEYRLLGTRVHITQPFVVATGLEGGSVIMSTDESGAATTPTSLQLAWQQGNAKVFNLDQTTPKPITYSARAVDLEDQDFTPVGISATTFQIFLAVNGGVSSIVCQFFIEFSVEFRSPQ
jgi:hypothetical protein